MRYVTSKVQRVGSWPRGQLPALDWDSYEILAPIGKGAMGEVYKARDSRLDRIAATESPSKVLRGSVLRTEQCCNPLGSVISVVSQTVPYITFEWTGCLA